MWTRRNLMTAGAASLLLAPVARALGPASQLDVAERKAAEYKQKCQEFILGNVELRLID